MKLLLAYDGSESADRAISDLLVAGLPDIVEAVVVTVAERWFPPPAAAQLAYPPEGERPGVERASNIASRACARLANLFPKWDVRAAVYEGSPASVILEDIEQWRPDLVVLGSNGQTNLEQLLLGSVSDKVASAAPCTVRVARGRIDETVRPVRLVVGLDATAEAQEAVRTIVSRRWPAGSSVLVFTALDHWLEGSPLQESELGWIDMLQRSTRDELASAGLAVELAVATGDPRRLIPERAREWDADCVFVGSHGRSRLKRFFLGSVASAVATRVECSVEIVRAENREH